MLLVRPSEQTSELLMTTTVGYLTSQLTIKLETYCMCMHYVA